MPPATPPEDRPSPRTRLTLAIDAELYDVRPDLFGVRLVRLDGTTIVVDEQGGACSCGLAGCDHAEALRHFGFIR
jgi:hypothetical protein